MEIPTHFGSEIVMPQPLTKFLPGDYTVASFKKIIR
jgi:hypothetical protein